MYTIYYVVTYVMLLYTRTYEYVLVRKKKKVDLPVDFVFRFHNILNSPNIRYIRLERLD